MSHEILFWTLFSFIVFFVFCVMPVFFAHRERDRMVFSDAKHQACQLAAPNSVCCATRKRQAPPYNCFGASSGPLYDLTIEARVAVLEEIARSTRGTLTRIEGQINALGNKLEGRMDALEFKVNLMHNYEYDDEYEYSEEENMMRMGI